MDEKDKIIAKQAELPSIFSDQVLHLSGLTYGVADGGASTTLLK